MYCPVSILNPAIPSQLYFLLTQFSAGDEYARVSGALTFVLASIGSKAELKSTLAYALEISGKDWAACLDKRQVNVHSTFKYLSKSY